MTHGPATPARERSRWIELLSITEMWASLAIIVMWLAVLFDAVYGPDIVSNGGGAMPSGGSSVPSAIVIALFAFLGTAVVAKHGFGRDKR